MHQIAKLLKSQLRDSVKQADLSDEMKKAIAKYDDAISNHPNWTVSDAAREAEMTEQYSNVYRSISQLGAHANISSLDQHLSDINQQLLTRGARKQDKESLINLTIECLALGMLRFSS